MTASTSIMPLSEDDIRKAAIHNSTTPFLRLPGEIRNKIYAHMWSAAERYIQSHGETTLPMRDYKGNRMEQPVWGGLIRACKQLHAESESFFLGDCKIRLKSTRTHWPEQFVAQLKANGDSMSAADLPYYHPELPPWLLQQPRAIFLHARDLTVQFDLLVMSHDGESDVNHILRVVLTVDGNTYSCRVWFGACDPEGPRGTSHPQCKKRMAEAAAEIRWGTIGFFQLIAGVHDRETEREYQLAEDDNYWSPRYVTARRYGDFERFEWYLEESGDAVAGLPEARRMPHWSELSAERLHGNFHPLSRGLQ